jgi:hypothetical protein
VASRKRSNPNATWRQHPGYRSERQFDRWARDPDGNFIWTQSSFRRDDYIKFLQNKGYDVSIFSKGNEIPKDVSLTRDFTRRADAIYGKKQEDYSSDRQAWRNLGRYLIGIGRVEDMRDYERRYPFRGSRTF